MILQESLEITSPPIGRDTNPNIATIDENVESRNYLPTNWQGYISEVTTYLDQYQSRNYLPTNWQGYMASRGLQTL